MKKSIILAVLILLSCYLSFAGCKKKEPDSGLSGTAGTQPPQVVPVRIGYTNNMVINAHIGLILSQTNILENNFLKGEVKSYDSDLLMLEDFNKGLLDVAFTLDFQGIKTVAKESKGLIFASFGSLGRIALMVKSDATVQYVKELKGLKIGVPFGTLAHYHLLKWLANDGINTNEVTLVDMEQSNLKTAVDNKIIDGAVFSDPEVIQYDAMSGGPYKRIADKYFTSLVILSRDFYNKNTKPANRLLTSFKQAAYYLSQRSFEINNLISNTKKIAVDILSWSALNNNYTAASAKDINITVANYLGNWNMLAQYLYEQKLIEKPFNSNEAINSDLQKEGERKLAPNETDLTKIKIISSGRG